MYAEYPFSFDLKKFCAEELVLRVIKCRGDTEENMRLRISMMTAGLFAAAALVGPAAADGLPGYQGEGPIYRAEPHVSAGQVYERETHTYERGYRRVEPPRVVAAPPAVVVAPLPVAPPVVVERRVVISPPVVVSRPVVVAPSIVAPPPAYAEECAAVSGVRPSPWGPRPYFRTHCF
jgi:hypothetical protein